MGERRTKFNLRRDGVKACAAHVVAAIGKTNGCHSVYIDWRKDVRVISDKCVKQKHRPDYERLGRYKSGITEKAIAADLTELNRMVDTIDLEIAKP